MVVADDPSILLADLGNRYLKLGRLQGGRAVQIDACLDVAREWNSPAGFSLEPVTAFWYASVHPARESALEAWVLRTFGIAAQKLGRDRPVPVKTSCQGVGVDRLLNASGAVARCPGGAIAVDVGTAITVDVVSPAREFLGGAILPGPHLGARALAEHAAQLFAVEPEPPVRAVGRSTEEAIRSGLHHGTVGAVAHMVAMIRREIDFEASLVLTGGDVRRYLDAFPDAVHVPALTLEGLAAIVREP